MLVNRPFKGYKMSETLLKWFTQKELTRADISISIPVAVFWELCHFVGTLLRLVTDFLESDYKITNISVKPP